MEDRDKMILFAECMILFGLVLLVMMVSSFFYIGTSVGVFISSLTVIPFSLMMLCFLMVLFYL